jgi:hypothetical protein
VAERRAPYSALVHDRYRLDALKIPPRRRTSRTVSADTGLVVEEVTTGWVGAITRVEVSGGMRVVTLENRKGVTRTFPMGPGFWIDGEPVELVPPVSTTPPARPSRTASGSIAVHDTPARVARASRIWVEGRHDAELVERVWGDDLRIEGVVVEMLDGADRLVDAVRDFGPSPRRRLGVLLDHLVDGSKESRIAVEAVRLAPLGSVLVVGHPYVDVWQAVRPDRVGLAAWPVVDRGTEWKRGVLNHLGWPSQTQADIAEGWRRILRSVHDFRDLEPAFLGRVEELIDFVTP